MAHPRKLKTSLAIFKVPILIFFLTFIFTFFQIYSSVKEKCVLAKQEFQKDCIGSLIEVVKSDGYSFEEKNGAVWAIGQIADENALPFLEGLLETASFEDPCKVNQNICGVEVKKAIKWCTKGNITSWMYRNL